MVEMTKEKGKEKKPEAEAEAPEAEVPTELTFKVEGKTLSQSAIVKVLADMGGKDLTSTAIRDALNFDKEQGRDRVRSIMNQLQNVGVVVIERKPVSEGAKRTRFFYSLKEEKSK